MNSQSVTLNKHAARTKGRIAQQIYRRRWLYILLLPGIAYFIIFKYVPMWGVLIAFQNYSPFSGFLNSPWVGLKHFDRLFTDPAFWLLFRNTFLLSLYNILLFFPLPIILALMLNELKNELFKRFLQTAIYVPHFVSWVVVIGITYVLLDSEKGIINQSLVFFGGEQINFLLSKDWFRFLYITEVIWKETGWGTIIFLAALSGVDPALYEAAKIDGANRWQQLWHVTLPAIRSTIVILLILRLGNFLDTGFEQIFLMMNAMNREVAEVFDTYIYAVGLQQGQFSYSTAIGIFKSVVGLLLIVTANSVAKKLGEEGVL